MNRKRKTIIAQNAISEVISLNLGGFEQKVMLEGKQTSLPIVITLHGGPGSPIPFSVGCRGMFPDFTDRFILVTWDQLGCGINNHVIDDTFRLENYIEMTLDLIKAIKKRFPSNKLILFGMSFGSVLALNAATRMKDAIDAVITWGQIIKEPIVNHASLNALKDSSLPFKKKKLLAELEGKPVTAQTVSFVARGLMKYTNAYTNREGKKESLLPIILSLMTSPDYRFRDFIAMVKNGYLKNTSLWNELVNVDYQKMLSEISVPYRILQGDTDLATNTDFVAECVKSSHNPFLSCEIFEKCGHIPGKQSIEVALDRLTSILK